MSVAWNPVALDQILNSPEGPIAADLGRRALRVETAAKLNATGRTVIGAVNPQSRGPRVRKDRLRSSIGWELRRDERGLFAAVGTNVFYGAYLELGWVSSRGNFFKYPFLVPALAAAA